VLFLIVIGDAFQARILNKRPYVSNSGCFVSSSSSSSLPSLTGSQDDGTISSWTNPLGQTITLVGTAHLSQKSNEQVEQVIQQVQPNVVMVELDKTRLSRIGINSVADIQNVEVITSEDITLPSLPNQPWYSFFLQAFAQIARKLLTGMYKDMSDSMKNKDGGGGEFLVAIRAAEKCPECTKLVLGDRDSVTTIQRAAQLAMESGKPLQVFQKLSEANGEEMEQLEQQVKKELGEDIDTGEFQVAMMERLKSDSEMRNRLFVRLEQEGMYGSELVSLFVSWSYLCFLLCLFTPNKVPEFTRAFLKERDYIMSRAIGRELEQDPSIQRAVAVVGLAHVPGIQANLEKMFQTTI
jgi:pheromone shutdown protein TraB